MVSLKYKLIVYVPAANELTVRLNKLTVNSYYILFDSSHIYTKKGQS